MLYSQLLKFTEYNLWANNKIMDFIIRAGEEKADVNIASSFPSIRKTVYHIYDAETIWLFRLKQIKPEYYPPSRDFNFSLEEFSRIFLAQSGEMINWLEVGEKNPGQSISYTTVKGDPYTNSIADIITHCVNHSTYHRGQIITLLRSSGFTDVGSTDYIAFCRS